jgi:hypothetical protein
MFHAEHLLFLWESGILEHARQRVPRDQPSIKLWVPSFYWFPLVDILLMLSQFIRNCGMSHVTAKGEDSCKLGRGFLQISLPMTAVINLDVSISVCWALCLLTPDHQTWGPSWVLLHYGDQEIPYHHQACCNLSDHFISAIYSFVSLDEQAILLLMGILGRLSQFYHMLSWHHVFILA